MTFLLAKTLFLLVLAAVLGAWLARWWLRRQYQDVTAAYGCMDGEWLTWRHAVSEKMEHPLVDLSPLNERLAKLEASMPATPDFAPLLGRLEGLEGAVGAMRIPGDTDRRLEQLEQSVRSIVIPPIMQVDLQPVLDKLATLEARASYGVTVPTVAAIAPHNPLVRGGSRNLLAHAAYGAADDLQRIKGVKTVLEKMLHDIGVYYFWQIAEWTAEDATHADAQLTAFHGRIVRDQWIVQAVQYALSDGAARKPAEF